MRQALLDYLLFQAVLFCGLEGQHKYKVVHLHLIVEIAKEAAKVATVLKVLSQPASEPLTILIENGTKVGGILIDWLVTIIIILSLLICIYRSNGEIMEESDGGQ